MYLSLTEISFEEFTDIKRNVRRFIVELKNYFGKIFFECSSSNNRFHNFARMFTNYHPVLGHPIY